MTKRKRDPKYNTREWKIKMAPHVDHECNCFHRHIRLAVRVATGGIEIEREWAPAVSAAAINSWLIHVRSLLYFFEPEPHHVYPDMLARHYLDDATWRQHEATFVLNDEIRSRIEDIGAFVAHINARRAEDDDLTGWGKREYDWVNERLTRWYGLLAPEWQERFPKLTRWVTDPSW